MTIFFIFLCNMYYNVGQNDDLIKKSGHENSVIVQTKVVSRNLHNGDKFVCFAQWVAWLQVK